MIRSHPETREGVSTSPCGHTQDFQCSLRGSPFSGTWALPQANSLALYSLQALQQESGIGDPEGATIVGGNALVDAGPALGLRPPCVYFLNGLSVNLLPGTAAPCHHPSLLVSHSHAWPSLTVNCGQSVCSFSLNWCFHSPGGWEALSGNRGGVVVCQA